MKKAGWIWGGYQDNAKLIPNPELNKNHLPMQPDEPRPSMQDDVRADMQNYLTKPIGYRLRAAWALLRPYDKWE